LHIRKTFLPSSNQVDSSQSNLFNFSLLR
jgi:hypothetical protein